MAHITIEFFPGGAVKIAPHGYPGEMCHLATKPYVDALRATQSQSVPTDEALQTETSVVQTQPQQELA